VSTARSLVEPSTAAGDRIDYLLHLAELKANGITDDLRRLARGLPVAGVLEADDGEAIVQLAERRSLNPVMTDRRSSR